MIEELDVLIPQNLFTDKLKKEILDYGRSVLGLPFGSDNFGSNRIGFRIGSDRDENYFGYPSDNFG